MPDDRWDRLVGQIHALGGQLDDRQRGEGIRYLLRYLAAGIAICTEHDNPDEPELGRLIENRMSWGLDNPDCLYSFTRVRAGETYRVAGNRGSACNLELQVNTGHFADGNFGDWRAVLAVGGDDLDCDPDGGFSLDLSPDDPETSFLLVRQYFADWEHESPADLTIERVGADYPPPESDDARMDDHLDLLETWLTAGAACWADFSAGLLAGEPGPIQPFVPPASASGLKGQAYGMGPFRCAPDEAVILTLEPPECRMWGVSLCNRWWESIEFGTRQSSLNNTQATADDDGIVRMVLSHDDPGVANWLDPGGHTEGTLAVRFLFDDDPPDPIPVADYRTVPRAEVDDHLPTTTARRTPAERSASLRRRYLALQRRYRK